jgi:sulfite reductase (NADPH) flavoprotein alpha-component
MQQGEIALGFLRRNPDFPPDDNRSPLILIGAGTGVGPLAGFIRQNREKRPIHLWFGVRHPDSDLFYGSELADWTKAGRLTALHTAFSRHGRKIYVQDALRENADNVRGLIAAGAKIMVCGGRDMASGVRDALGDILAPMTAADLKVQGRYVEDVY